MDEIHDQTGSPAAKRLKPSDPDAVLSIRVGAENTLCLPMLPALLEDSTTHDVTFKTADGGSLGDHRAIVAASSPVFHAMLYGRAKESKESEIHLSSINTDMLKMIFTFLYTGVVQVNTDECLGLLQAAHYFNISTLEAKCGEVLVSTLDIDSNFSNTVKFAIEQQLDLLLKQCLDFMEIHADKLIHTVGFNTLPLCVIKDFLKSSNLEVKEIDLFLAISKWIEHQENELSPDDKKLVFQLIRYPLIHLTDLLEIVRSSQLADHNLYTAALEYHCMRSSKICESEFAENQLTLRKYYFKFLASHNLSVKCTGKGTVISIIQDTIEGMCALAEVYPTSETSVNFRLNVKKHSSDRIQLGGYYKGCQDITNSLCCNGEMKGSIALTSNFLMTKIGKNVMTIAKRRNEDTCVMYIFIKGRKDTKILITRL